MWSISPRQKLFNVRKEVTIFGFTLMQLVLRQVYLGYENNAWDFRLRSFVLGVKNSKYIFNLNQTLIRLKGALDFIFRISVRKGACAILNEQVDLFPYFSTKWDYDYLGNDSYYESASTSLYMLFERAIRGVLTNKLLYKYRKSCFRVFPHVWFFTSATESHYIVEECRKVGIPSICIFDSVSFPVNATYTIPGNEKSWQAVQLYTTMVFLTNMRARLVLTNLWNEKLTKRFIDKLKPFLNHPLFSVVGETVSKLLEFGNIDLERVFQKNQKALQQIAIRKRHMKEGRGDAIRDYLLRDATFKKMATKENKRGWMIMKSPVNYLKTVDRFIKRSSTTKVEKVFPSLYKISRANYSKYNKANLILNLGDGPCAADQKSVLKKFSSQNNSGVPKKSETKPERTDRQSQRIAEDKRQALILNEQKVIKSKLMLNSKYSPKKVNYQFMLLPENEWGRAGPGVRLIDKVTGKVVRETRVRLDKDGVPTGVISTSHRNKINLDKRNEKRK